LKPAAQIVRELDPGIGGVHDLKQRDVFAAGYHNFTIYG